MFAAWDLLQAEQTVINDLHSSVLMEMSLYCTCGRNVCSGATPCFSALHFSFSHKQFPSCFCSIFSPHNSSAHFSHSIKTLAPILGSFMSQIILLLSIGKVCTRNSYMSLLLLVLHLHKSYRTQCFCYEQRVRVLNY